MPDFENGALSLILTFSRWEKEQSLAIYLKSESLSAACRICPSGWLETILPLVSEFPSNLVCEKRLGKMGLSCRLQAAGQWRGRVRNPLALAVGHVRREPEPFVPVS